jgi:hypothetical protein
MSSTRSRFSRVSFEAPLGLAAALAVLRDAGGFLEEHAQLLRLRLDDAGDHPLLDDRVGPGAQAGAEEQVAHVAATDGDVVDVVAGVAVPFEHALDGDLAVLRPGAGRPAEAVVEHEFDAGPVGGLAVAGAVEDDVLHGLAAQMLGGRLAEHPAHGVDHVGLAAAVRTDDADELPGQGHVGRVDERLEAGELDVGKAHSENPTGRRWTVNLGSRPGRTVPRREKTTAWRDERDRRFGGAKL